MKQVTWMKTVAASDKKCLNSVCACMYTHTHTHSECTQALLRMTRDAHHFLTLLYR